MAIVSAVQRYTVNKDRLNALGIKLIAFSCPGCAREIETEPLPIGETQNSLSECPFCSALFKKSVQGENAYAIKLNGRANDSK